MKSYKQTILKQQEYYYDSYSKIENNPRFRKIWKYISYNCEPKGKILDIGCTNGIFSEILIKKGFNCFGLEIMDQAIKEAEKKGLRVRKGSFLDKFPFNSNMFDIVFAGDTIEHTIDDGAFLKEIHRVLKKDGLMILTTANLVSLGNRLLILLGKLPRFVYSEFHYKIYTPDLLKSKIVKSGFEIQKVDSSYVIISMIFNKFIGRIGEWFGSQIPELGEGLIVYATKK